MNPAQSLVLASAIQRMIDERLAPVRVRHPHPPSFGPVHSRRMRGKTVLFNAYAADLWRRFITYLPRHLARRLDITQKLLRSLARIRFVKMAEYQSRGVVHFHAVIRLDASGDGYQPPAGGHHRRHPRRGRRPGRRRRPAPRHRPPAARSS
jgi:Replication initiator protein, pSAM2